MSQTVIGANKEVLSLADPAGPYFLVELDPEDEAFRGRILLPERHRRFSHRIGTVRKVGPEAGPEVWIGRRVVVSDHAMSLSKDEHDRSMRICTMLDVQLFVAEAACSPPT